MLLNPSQARALYEFATRHQFAILAVNADSPAAVLDVLEAARSRNAPIIVETSLWQLKGHSFGFGDPLLGLARYLADLAVLADSERYRDTPVIYHTDHIKGPDTKSILQAAIRGIETKIGAQSCRLIASSVSLDSSELTPEANIALMRALCETADERGEKATLEMEAGVDQGVTPLEDTEKVFGSVEQSHPGHLALWAPGVGTLHGFGSGNRVDPEAIARHQALATKICNRPIGLALHGSSGLTNEALTEAVAAGTVKVNWSSESLLIRSQAARHYYAEHTSQLERHHAEFKQTAMDNGVQTHIATQYLPLVAERIDLLGGRDQGARFIASLKTTKTDG